MLRKVAGAVAASGVLTFTAREAYCDDSSGKSNDPSKGFFDPEALERGAKAIREIDRSTNAKAVYEQLKQQELTKQADLKKQEAEQIVQARAYEGQTEQIRQQEENKREQERGQRQSELMQQQAQLEEHKLKQQASLTRQTNEEYLEQQKQIALQVEQRKLEVAQLMEAERKQTAQYEADQAKQVAIEKAMAEGRARALEHRENRDIFMEEITQSATEWGKQYMVLLQESLKSLGTGTKLLLTTDLGPRALGGAAALFGAYYGIRGGFGLAYKQLERFLVTPPLVRETSRYNMLQRVRTSLGFGSRTPVAMDSALAAADKTFADVILAPEVKHSVRSLAASAANTRRHGAPFRHYLLYGPPGTGKTLLAKRLAHTSGLDYAIMSGGDVAPLGADAVKQMHDMFDWAKRSSKGMLLFVDEADAFLSQRGVGQKSEAMRSAINALLYRTGDQSQDYMVILATNRPEDLDVAVLDRVDEQLEVGLPNEDLRRQLLELYFQRYVTLEVVGERQDTFVTRAQNVLAGRPAQPETISLAGFDRATALQKAAAKTEGFSGRELAKLVASVQAAAYGTPDATLTAPIFDMVLDNKIKQHDMRTAMVA